jgi:hypothetical protein
MLSRDSNTSIRDDGGSNLAAEPQFIALRGHTLMWMNAGHASPTDVFEWLLGGDIPRWLPCQPTALPTYLAVSRADAQPTGDWCNRRSNLRMHELHCRLQQNEAAGSRSNT